MNHETKDNMNHETKDNIVFGLKMVCILSF